MPRKAHTSTQCLNCGEVLQGKYCHNCGQDILDHHESIWHLFKHFFEDITHYEGKLWKTLKPLLFSPGLLTTEYLQGRRVSYLQPVRMFIFLNFVFFLIWFSLPQSQIGDSQIKLKVKPGMEITKHEKDDNDYSDTSAYDVSGYKSMEHYESEQAKLPKENKDGILTHKAYVTILTIISQSKNNPNFLREKILEPFNHNLPKLNFFFLIICTLTLGVLYYRKHLFMFDHAIFSIHMACTFLMLSVFIILFKQIPTVGSWLGFIIFLYGNYYFYQAMRHVYQQSRGKTTLKFILLNTSLSFFMVIGLLLNLAFAAMSVKAE